VPAAAADDRPVDSYARLLSLAVHEFRTPASVVAGYLRMLLHDTGQPLTDRHRRMLEEAERSCGRIVALVNELNEIAKLDAGTAPLADEPFDLFAVVSEVAAGVHEAEDRDVRLRVGGDEHGAPMRGDAGRLRTAFAAFFRAILREQAAAATVVAERRRVVRDGGGAAMIVVAPAPGVQRAYEAPPAAFDEGRGGLGLALPLARRVIERHGGRVWTPAPDGAARAASALVVSLPLEKPSR
jgi:signal transduction histidine kinase